MICDKCGKNNIQSLGKCSYCGAEMPKTSGGGGFADILSYNMGECVSSQVKTGEDEMGKRLKEINEEEIQKLIKMTDSLIKSTKRKSLLGSVAVVLSGLVLVSSTVLGVVTVNKVKEYEKELAEYKTQLDALIEKNEDKNGETEKESEFEEADDKTDVSDEAVAEDEAAAENEKAENPSLTKPDEEGISINKKTEELKKWAATIK